MTRHLPRRPKDHNVSSFNRFFGEFFWDQTIDCPNVAHRSLSPYALKKSLIYVITNVGVRNISETDLESLWPQPIASTSSLVVHVRMGDACNKIVYRTLPKNAKGMWSEGCCATRKCVHYQVYVEISKKLHATYNYDTIVLVTDNEDAKGAFFEEFGSIVQSSKRSLSSFYASPSWKQNTKWIEHRTDTTPDIVLSSLEDVRRVRGGTMFLGSACGNYAQVLYWVTSVYAGRSIPYVSVDECEFHNDVGPL
eukprot:gene3525-4438_t